MTENTNNTAPADDSVEHTPEATLENTTTLPPPVDDNPSVTSVKTGDEELDARLDGATSIEDLIPVLVANREHIKKLNDESKKHRLGKRAAEETNQHLSTRIAELEKLLSDTTANLGNTLETTKKQLQEQLEEANDKLAMATESEKKARLDAERIRIGNKYKLPDALVSRLVGSTPEEIEEDAKTLKLTLPSVNITTDGSTGLNRPSQGISRLELKEQKRRDYGRM
jgi:hypothetical protein